MYTDSYFKIFFVAFFQLQKYSKLIVKIKKLQKCNIVNSLVYSVPIFFCV